MLSSIAAYLFGSPATTTTASPPADDCIHSSISNIKDDVAVKDSITSDSMDDVSQVIENVVSTSSLSDEESGWVFVNNRVPGSFEPYNPTSEITNETNGLEQPEVGRERAGKKSGKTVGAPPITKSKNIPHSALHASSVLTALAELRPQQKSERRLRERHLKRKQMERCNKVVQENSSSNRPSKRRSMYNSGVFSNAVNNRKC